MNPLSVISTANTFYQSVVCLITFLILSFNKRKLFVLIKFNFSIFYFLANVFGILFKKFCSNKNHEDVLSSRKFIGLLFTFTSMIHLKLILMYCVRVRSTFEKNSRLNSNL